MRRQLIELVAGSLVAALAAGCATSTDAGSDYLRRVAHAVPDAHQQMLGVDVVPSASGNLFTAYSLTTQGDTPEIHPTDIEHLSTIATGYGAWNIFVAAPEWTPDAVINEVHGENASSYAGLIESALRAVDIHERFPALPFFELDLYLFPAEGVFAMEIERASEEGVSLGFGVLLPAEDTEQGRRAHALQLIGRLFHEYYHAVTRSSLVAGYPDAISEEVGAYLFGLCTVATVGRESEVFVISLPDEFDYLLDEPVNLDQLLKRYGDVPSAIGRDLALSIALSVVGSTRLPAGSDELASLMDYCGEYLLRGYPFVNDFNPG